MGTARYRDSPSRVLGVDRGLDRRPRRFQGHVCAHSTPRMTSLQVKQTLRTSVPLLIRWFSVRPPGAPPAVLCFHLSIELGKAARARAQEPIFAPCRVPL